MILLEQLLVLIPIGSVKISQFRRTFKEFAERKREERWHVLRVTQN